MSHLEINQKADIRRLRREKPLSLYFSLPLIIMTRGEISDNTKDLNSEDDMADDYLSLFCPLCLSLSLSIYLSILIYTIQLYLFNSILFSLSSRLMAEAEGGLSDDNIDRNSEDEDMADDSSDSSDDEHQWTKEVFFIQSVGYGSAFFCHRI